MAESETSLLPFSVEEATKKDAKTTKEISVKVSFRCFQKLKFSFWSHFNFLLNQVQVVKHGICITKNDKFYHIVNERYVTFGLQIKSGCASTQRRHCKLLQARLVRSLKRLSFQNCLFALILCWLLVNTLYMAGGCFVSNIDGFQVDKGFVS